MADEYDDDVFVVENGIAANQNVPLILEQNMENNEGFEQLNEMLDFDADNQVMEGNDQDLLHGELEGLQDAVYNQQNGFHTSVSSSLSAAPSSSAVFDPSEILDASSRRPSVAAGGFTNEGYQTDISELSEFTASVEILPETLQASFKKATTTDITMSCLASKTEAASTRFNVNQQHNPFNTNTGLTPQASTSSFDDNSERFQLNPPNSPAGSRGPLPTPGNSQRFRRSNRVPANPQVPQPNLPDRPNQLFVKCGSFLLMLVFLFLLAIIACLQRIFPSRLINIFAGLLIVCLVGAVCCFLKVCMAGNEQIPRRPRSCYGST